MRRRSPAVLMSLCLGFALLMAVGCKKSRSYEEMKEENRQAMAPILEKHRAAATARIEAIQEIAKDARWASRTTTPEPPEPGLKIPENRYELVKGGLLLANVEWAAAADGTNEAKVKYDADLPLHMLVKAMKDGHNHDSGHSPEGADESFKTLTNLKHLALIRIYDYDPPEAIFTGGEQRFEGAEAKGDVLIYDLETRKRVGAFPYEVQQGPNAKVTRGASDETMSKELERFFTSEFKYALLDEVTAYGAGKSGPAAPGAAAKTSLQSFADKIRSEVGTEFLLSGPKKVDIAAGEGGKPLVTIYADTPNMLALKDGTVLKEVRAIVEKVLGRDADIKVVKAE